MPVSAQIGLPTTSLTTFLTRAVVVMGTILLDVPSPAESTVRSLGSLLPGNA